MFEQIPADQFGPMILAFLKRPILKCGPLLSYEPHGWHTNTYLSKGLLLLSLPPESKLSVAGRVFDWGGDLVVHFNVLQSPTLREHSPWLQFTVNYDFRQYLLSHQEIFLSSQLFDHTPENIHTTSINFTSWNVPPLVFRDVIETVVREKNLSGEEEVLEFCRSLAIFISQAVLDIKETLSKHGFRLISQG